jgi:hypothetical protein
MILVMPWIMLFDWIRNGFKFEQNSGHGAGLGQGFLVIAALFVGAMEIMALIVILFIISLFII